MLSCPKIRIEATRKRHWKRNLKVNVDLMILWKSAILFFLVKKSAIYFFLIIWDCELVMKCLKIDCLSYSSRFLLAD
ncbi:hypothetical protein M9H77_35085 [Catharanthus roseus]|uniref:Uncharacterized protein n=1 Tax=Catharanthus roseus TaxID=4058 RepID=A0ACB9ZNR7_CATRO|nr:hypothetical protein M9H77_35085 [Catharanthus roseus]